jgi:hypothetical protein
LRGNLCLVHPLLLQSCLEKKTSGSYSKTSGKDQKKIKMCQHKRKKKIYNHGKKSKAEIIECKTCGEILKRHILAKEYQKRRPKRK